MSSVAFGLVAADQPVLLPPGDDYLWALLPLGVAVFSLVAVVSVIRAMRVAQGQYNAALVLWLLVVLVAPVVGPLCWFIVGRAKRDERQLAPSAS